MTGLTLTDSRSSAVERVAERDPGSAAALPALVLAYYGDDFTGSTDVMEALSSAGLRTVLFMDPPAPETLAKFDGLRAYGVAGTGRTMPPSEMDEKLTPLFERFKRAGGPLVHYKICSTFDSSPEVGSIGKAIDIGQSVFRGKFVPVQAGAPVLGRYCVFGNLFARSGLDSEPFRLDRHPTMRCHPVTPMDESDLREILAKQTQKSIGLFDLIDLEAADAAGRFSKAAPSEIVILDTLNERHLEVIGELLWQHANPERPLFTVGSSGVEYALTAYWKARGLLPETRERIEISPVDQLAVVSGSCSPVTARQIGRAIESGFADLTLNTEKLVDETQAESECERAVSAALDALAKGRSIILHACRGPDDERLKAAKVRLLERGVDRNAAVRGGRLLAQSLGRILKAILGETRLRRAVVTGGDTSTGVARELGIEALEFARPVAPGSPLCRIHTSGALDGAEITFKGGQVGKADFFTRALTGREP